MSIFLINYAFAQCGFSSVVLVSKSRTGTIICANTDKYFFEIIGGSPGSYTYQWTAPANTTIKGTGSEIELIAGDVTVGGTDKLKVFLSDICGGTKELEIDLTWNDVPDVSGASITGLNTICVGESQLQTYELIGIKNSVDDYNWFAINKGSLLIITQTTKIVNTNFLSTSVRLDPTEVNREITISVKPENACGQGITVTGNVQIDNEPTKANLTDPNLKVCIKDKIFLTGNIPVIGTGIWTKTSNQSGTIENIKDPISEIFGLVGGDTFTGTWTISNGICPSSNEDLRIEVFGVADPTINLSLLHTILCEGESSTLTLQGNNLGTNPIYEFLDESNNVLQTGNKNTYTFTPSETIKVKGKVTSNFFCVSTGNEIVESALQKITVTPKEQCTITSVSDNETNDLVIYPNPFSTSITLNHIPTTVEKIEVIDLMGNVVESVTEISNSLEVGASLPTGTYLIYLHSIDDVQIQKIVKIN